MKKILFTAVLAIISCTAQVNAQTCDAPYEFYGFECTINNPADFTSYLDNWEEVYWQSICGTDKVHIKGFFEYEEHRDIRGSFELWVEEFSCSGISLGDPTFLESTPLTEYGGVPYFGGATEVTIDYSFEREIDPTKNVAYRVKLKYKQRVLTGWGIWTYRFSEMLRILPSETPPDPNGYFSEVLSTETRTSAETGYTVDIHQLDFNEDLKFHATPTTCENKWKYEISKFDLDSWSSSNILTSPWIHGEAGIVDMSAFYTYGFVQNELYMVKLIAGNGWQEEFYWFEIKAAKLVGRISLNNGITETVGMNSYQVHLMCENSNVTLNATGTESVDKYRIRVQMVDPSFNLIGPEGNTFIQDGPVPLYEDLQALYGYPFLLNTTYRVVYEVTAPGQTEIYYFRYVDCGDDDSNYKAPSNSALASDKLEEIKVYPNPLQDNLIVEFSNDDFQENIKVFIVNALGQTVYSNMILSTTVDEKIQINLEHLSNGIYFLNVSDGINVSQHRLLKN